MEYSNRNFAVAYLFLVALPVLGLVGVLRGGRTLTAPLSVGGSWKAELSSSSSSLPQCAAALSAPDAALIISQSGRNFTMSFTNLQAASASGAIDGTAVKASVVSPAGCSHTLSLIASLDPTAKPESLTGTLSFSDCPNCPPIPFHAVREEQAKAKGSH